MKKEVSFDTKLVVESGEDAGNVKVDVLEQKHGDDEKKLESNTQEELPDKMESSPLDKEPQTNIASDTVQPVSASPSTSDVSAQPRFSQQQITPSAPLLIPPAEEEMLVGFGRNQYGRFSLAGAYNPRTGTLRCERKYMLTKFITPVKQSRLSTKNADDGCTKRPVRAKRSYSVDTADSSTSVQAATSSGKRKRTSSLWAQDGSHDATHDTATPSSTSSKRGKKKGHLGASFSVMTSTEFLSGMENLAEKEGYRRAFLDPATGEVYEGEWINGQRNGFGVCLFPDGTMYEGWWLNNKEHGPSGLWMTGTREVLYSGEWAEGRIHGTGTYYFPSGDVYTGEFKEGAKHGKGRYVKADGSSYDGDWKDNVRHGRGLFTWADGSEFEGDWEFGQRSGRGELVLSNNLAYSGSWACNFMEGRGELIFPDGQQYKGVFKNGLREGRGSIVFPEGATYEGRFREDALDGQGTLKISQTVPGGAEDELFIPLDNLADIRRIHYKSGFGGDAHH
jgi:hypothetical protein